MAAFRSVAVSLLFSVALLVGMTPASLAEAKHSATDATVESRADGTEIAITVFQPAAADAAPVPVVLHSHGWAGSRATEVGGVVERFLDAGFGVVSIDQRGHGESGGQANVQDPELETEDIKSVIDYIAGLDWVRLDGPGDPVLGAIGGSYGGGYQTMTALDEIHNEGRTRFNALAPEITWYDLPESLAPQKVVRTAWNVLLYGAGARMVPNFIHEAFVWGSATSQWPDGTFYGQKNPAVPNLDKVFHRHSPVWFAERGIRIDVPVLVRQGTSDNLFDLNEGLKLFDDAVSSDARKQSYFVAYNGGHALPNAAPPGYASGGDACSPKGDFTKLTIAFFSRVFGGETTDGLLPSRYNLTTDDAKKCIHLDDIRYGSPLDVQPPVGQTAIATAGLGAPLRIPVAEGPVRVAGYPVLKGKVTSIGLDARAFFGLAVGTTPADALVVQNNLLPLHRILPVTDDRFEIELPGVAVEVPKGKTLYLTIAPNSDMYFGHSSRTPGSFVLENLKLSLPGIEAGPGR